MGTTQHRHADQPSTRSPVPASPRIDPNHVRHLSLSHHLDARMRIEAERAVLELDALMVGARQFRSVRRRLAARRDEVISDWADCLELEGGPTYAGSAIAAAERVFRNRVHELRAAAAPGGHA